MRLCHCDIRCNIYANGDVCGVLAVAFEAIWLSVGSTARGQTSTSNPIGHSSATYAEKAHTHIPVRPPASHRVPLLTIMHVLTLHFAYTKSTALDWDMPMAPPGAQIYYYIVRNLIFRVSTDRCWPILFPPSSFSRLHTQLLSLLC